MFGEFGTAYVAPDLFYTKEYVLHRLSSLFAVLAAMAAGLLALTGDRLPAPAAEPTDELARLWPSGLKMPTGLRLYRKTEYSQHLTITNGYDLTRVVRNDQDDHFANAPTRPNGNRLFPWRVPGGMDRVADWTSTVGIAIPEGKHVRYWGERIEAGARRPLPRTAWSFPIGTRVVDILAVKGEPFEVRLLRKTAKGWKAHTAWESGHWPAGYSGPGRKCIDCHARAGAWERYGALVRGSDSVFSWAPFVEGTLVIDTKTFPVKHWDEP